MLQQRDSIKLMQEAARMLKSACEGSGSGLLQALVTPGMRFPEMQSALQQLTSATDWESACETGQIVPSQVSMLLRLQFALWLCTLLSYCPHGWPAAFQGIHSCKQTRVQHGCFAMAAFRQMQRLGVEQALERLTLSQHWDAAPLAFLHFLTLWHPLGLEVPLHCYWCLTSINSTMRTAQHLLPICW